MDAKLPFILLPLEISMLFFFMLQGCGNVIHPVKSLSSPNLQASLYGSESRALDGTVQTSENRNSTYDCPFEPNILPKVDFEFNGSRRYKVCQPLAASSSKILIHGRPAEGDTICVFPVQETSPTDIRARVDRVKNRALTRCISINGLKTTPPEGVEITFEGVTFNATIIVDGIDSGTMEYCLRMGILQSPFCPRYSYGVFRK